ncbi:MAG: Re/Si-specific NAD(P)(+) transhydrogenase subunit alpha [Nitrospirae bacterium]|nr:Re/Si-specific NAD(P)(+) transhydrogenase subunit alpha [Nitrospirota bacterium]
MKIAVPKESASDEKRVALIPESVKRLTAKGFEVIVESKAGEASFIDDAEYTAAGAKIESDTASLMGTADLILKVQVPQFHEGLKKHEVDMMREGTFLIGLLQPLVRPDLIKQLSDRKITAFSMDAIPRTTLAQSMDALSSMSTIAGYMAVIVAARTLPKFFPMFMTAAGTIAPAKVLILGAGVAGLQAVATAKRLGAVVEAFDQRPVVKEQVESLGVKFVVVPTEGEEAQTAGGYAKELSENYKKKQAELIHKHVVKSDIVISTALIPGKRAPILITQQMVQSMKSGSVIVDIAAEAGGNCDLTEPGKEVVKHGVTIIGLTNIPSMLPVHASQMYSRNIEKFLLHLADKTGFKMNMDDEITRGSLITQGGTVVHAMTREKLENEKVKT